MVRTASGYRLVFGYLGIFLVLIGAIVISPLIVLFFYPSEAGVAVNFVSVGLISVAVGIVLAIVLLKGREKRRLGKYQDFVLILMIWLSAILIGSIPFLLRGDMDFTQSFFESTSGFTTTGLSVFDFSVDPNVYGFHVYTMYRSILIFFGGIGLVLILVSALSDRYGMRLYSSEGHNDRLLPNLARSSRLMLSIYFGFVVLGTVAYFLAGMNVFDALNHSMAAVGTGGFSTSPDGILYVGGNLIAIEVISMFLMMAGATNFVIHLFVIRGRIKKAFFDLEVRFMLLLFLIFIPLFTLLIYFANDVPAPTTVSFFDALRLGAFYMISSVTTTGFNSYQPVINLGSAAIMMSICLMFIGGASGSSAGGVKLSRVWIVLKGIYYNLFDLLSSNRVIKPRSYYRYGQEKEYTNETLNESSAYLFLYLLVLIIGTTIITLIPAGISFEDALYEATSALATTGLSVGVTHASQNPGVLWVLIVLMIFGRLEIMAVYNAFLRIGRDIARKETI